MSEFQRVIRELRSLSRGLGRIERNIPTTGAVFLWLGIIPFAAFVVLLAAVAVLL